MRTVLGIPVDDELMARWRGWYSPPYQPFRVDPLEKRFAALVPSRALAESPEWCDTFAKWYGGDWTWLAEEEFRALDPEVRRALMDIRRRGPGSKPSPVWPSELRRRGDAPLIRWVEAGVRPSRHTEVPGDVWERARDSLPGADRLAGTYAVSGSGANCFATVMAAAGVPDVASTWVTPEPFVEWLRASAIPVTGTGQDTEPGVVFVWTEHGAVAHAAISIGGGWMLSKPSQCWNSPRLVRNLREDVNGWRFPGTRLSRHRLIQPG